MFEMLKRTTAIAALAALPFSPVAAQTSSGDASSTQSQSTQNQSSRGSSGGQTTDLQNAPKAAEQQAQQNEQLIQQQTPSASEQASQSGSASGQGSSQGQSAQSGDTQGAGSSGNATAQGNDAQQGSATGENAQSGTQSGSQSTAQAGQGSADEAENQLIATVGDAEIRRSDVIEAIGQLPPQLQQQAPQMLIPLALDQLVTRELILQEARGTDLAEDPEVLALAPDNATETARENALVQVWLDRQLKERVTDEKVQASYDAIKQQFGDQAPELDQVRPQIEGELRQQAFAEISSDLQADAEITVYGPDGQPVTQ